MKLITDLLLGLVKLCILFIGGMMLLGGGSCATIMMISSLDRFSSEVLSVTLIALIVAGLGWLIIKAGNSIRFSDEPIDTAQSHFESTKPNDTHPQE